MLKENYHRILKNIRGKKVKLICLNKQLNCVNTAVILSGVHRLHVTPTGVCNTQPQEAGSNIIQKIQLVTFKLLLVTQINSISRQQTSADMLVLHRLSCCTSSSVNRDLTHMLPCFSLLSICFSYTPSVR